MIRALGWGLLWVAGLWALIGMAMAHAGLWPVVVIILVVVALGGLACLDSPEDQDQSNPR